MITTIEELDALPLGSIIQTSNGRVLSKDSVGWWSFDDDLYGAEELAHMLPATLLIPNTISQGQFREALREFLKPRHGVEIEGEYIPAFAVALKMLGIEVSDE